jgi:hypothetical protein
MSSGRKTCGEPIFIPALTRLNAPSVTRLLARHARPPSGELLLLPRRLLPAMPHTRHWWFALPKLGPREIRRQGATLRLPPNDRAVTCAIPAIIAAGARAGAQWNAATLPGDGVKR